MGDDPRASTAAKRSYRLAIAANSFGSGVIVDPFSRRRTLHPHRIDRKLRGFQQAIARVVRMEIYGQFPMEAAALPTNGSPLCLTYRRLYIESIAVAPQEPRGSVPPQQSQPPLAWMVQTRRRDW